MASVVPRKSYFIPAAIAPLSDKTTKKVVVIGGGLSGMMVAKKLQDKAKVTIVMAESWVEWQIAGTYSLTRPDEFSKAAAPLRPSMLKQVTYAVGLVTKLEDGRVLLADGEILEFDYCVLCVGFAMPVVKPALGASFASRSEEVKRFGAAIRAAKSVAILGGGPVGVELAGDVREVVSKITKVTLVCRGGVLPACSEKYRKKTAAKLTDLGIDVVTDEIIGGPAQGSSSPGYYKLKSGGSLEVDVLLPGYTTGFQTDFLKDFGVVDSQGCVAVNEFMQCTAKPKVFAVGCTNVKEFTGIPKIEGQAKTAVANLQSLIAGGSATTKHAEGAPFMKTPFVQKIGHDTYAWMDTGNAPPPVACCARIGFPCCPPPCCWFCVCHPCCCAGPCADPEGRALAAFFKPMVHKSAGFQGLKGFGEPPEQQAM